MIDQKPGFLKKAGLLRCQRTESAGLGQNVFSDMSCDVSEAEVTAGVSKCGPFVFQT